MPQGMARQPREEIDATLQRDIKAEASRLTAEMLNYSL